MVFKNIFVISLETNNYSLLEHIMRLLVNTTFLSTDELVFKLVNGAMVLIGYIASKL